MIISEETCYFWTKGLGQYFRIPNKALTALELEFSSKRKDGESADETGFNIYCLRTKE